MQDNAVKPKKIVMAVLNDVVHDSRVIREATALQQAGYEITVIGIKSKPDQSDHESLMGIKVIRVNPFSFENVFSRSPWKIIQFYLPFLTYGTRDTKALYQTLVNQNPDFFHAHDLNTLLCVYRAAKKNLTPLVYDSHELFIETMNQGSFGKLLQQSFKFYYKTIERILIKRVKFVITVSDSIATELSTRYSVERPIIIKNVPLNDSIKRKINLRADYNLSDDMPIVLYQGGLRGGRGLYELIQSFKYVPVNYRLCIMGNGPLKQQLITLVQKLDIKNKIIFIDAVPQDELLSYTVNADIGIVFLENKNLNQHYGLPNKLFEYMSVGVPVLGINLPEIKKVVIEERIGIIVDHLDPKLIADKIQELQNHPENANFSQNGKKAFAQHYNWKIESDKLISAYKKLTDS